MSYNNTFTRFPVNLTEILNKQLVGTTYRYCSYNKPVTTFKVLTERKTGATIQQFKDNPIRFGRRLSKEIQIGTHKMFEESKIVKVYIDNDEWDEGGLCIYAILENGKTVSLNVK